jgi:hypothetical protein
VQERVTVVGARPTFMKAAPDVCAFRARRAGAEPVRDGTAGECAADAIPEGSTL